MTDGTTCLEDFLGKGWSGVKECVWVAVSSSWDMIEELKRKFGTKSNVWEDLVFRVGEVESEIWVGIEEYLVEFWMKEEENIKGFVF